MKARGGEARGAGLGNGFHEMVVLPDWASPASGEPGPDPATSAFWIDRVPDPPTAGTGRPRALTRAVFADVLAEIVFSGNVRGAFLRRVSASTYERLAKASEVIADDSIGDEVKAASAWGRYLMQFKELVADAQVLHGLRLDRARMAALERSCDRTYRRKVSRRSRHLLVKGELQQVEDVVDSEELVVRERPPQPGGDSWM